MQYTEDFRHRSEEEDIKDHGLTLDYDEIARRGTMGKEEKLISKWYGIYGSRQPGNHMARVVIPGGQLSTTKARNIADVAEHFAQGKINITVRQALQLHWLKVGALPDMLRELQEEGNSTFHGCGDVTRTIASCPLAETCQYRRFDVRGYAQETMRYLTECRDLDNLPRKYKLTFSGCPAGCAQPYMNCAGVVAVQRKVEPGKGAGPGGAVLHGRGHLGSDDLEDGFQVVIGGGMGWEAYVAQELFSFVPVDRILPVSRAIGLLFRDHGDRFNRQTSRLKFVVARQGIDECRRIVLENLRNEKVPTDGISWKSFEEAGVVFPERPLTEENPVGTDGKLTVRAMIPMGELDVHQLRALAELADTYGDQNLYTTNRQNIEFRGVLPKDAQPLRKGIESLGYRTDGFFGLRDMVPCVGTSYCPKAVANTREVYKLLESIVSEEKYKVVEKQAIIHITGCPNSCSPWRIADIGFRGMRIREESGSVEGFQVLLGGDQRRHGQVLGEFKTTDITTVVRTVLDTFVDSRKPEETLTKTVLRVGLETFKKAVYA